MCESGTTSARDLTRIAGRLRVCGAASRELRIDDGHGVRLFARRTASDRASLVLRSTTSIRTQASPVQTYLAPNKGRQQLIVRT